MTDAQVRAIHTTYLREGSIDQLVKAAATPNAARAS